MFRDFFNIWTRHAIVAVTKSPKSLLTFSKQIFAKRLNNLIIQDTNQKIALQLLWKLYCSKTYKQIFLNIIYFTDEFSWTVEGSELSLTHEEDEGMQTSTATLKRSDLKEDEENRITCTVRNEHGSQSKTFRVNLSSYIFWN